jgi:hypothetical protein
MTTKTFDSVKLMRDLRDKLSQEMAQMTPEERIRFIRNKAASMTRGITRDRARDEPAR